MIVLRGAVRKVAQAGVFRASVLYIHIYINMHTQTDGELGSKVPGSSTFFSSITPARPSPYQMYVKVYKYAGILCVNSVLP